jgi:hypothetical protein
MLVSHHLGGKSKWRNQNTVRSIAVVVKPVNRIRIAKWYSNIKYSIACWPSVTRKAVARWSVC